MITFNHTAFCQQQIEYQLDQRYEVWFWLLAAFLMLVVAMGTVLNSLVIHFTNQRSLEGTFRHLNTVVRNLAVSDLLYGLLACPLLLQNIRMRKTSHKLAYKHL